MSKLEYFTSMHGFFCLFHILWDDFYFSSLEVASGSGTFFVLGAKGRVYSLGHLDDLFWYFPFDK